MPDQIAKPKTVTFGFEEEWQDFERRNRAFLEKFPGLEKTLRIAFNRDTKLSEPIDKFVLMFGRVCVEDFFEILLCCGNGNGQAAQKLLRGLYERAVTLRYLREHPEEIEDFLDFYHVTQRLDRAQRKEADQALRVAHNVLLDVLRVQDEHFSVPGLKEQNEVCLQEFVDIWQKPNSTGN
jgi:hypothetical protein